MQDAINSTPVSSGNTKTMGVVQYQGDRIIRGDFRNPIKVNRASLQRINGVGKNSQRLFVVISKQ